MSYLKLTETATLLYCAYTALGFVEVWELNNVWYTCLWMKTNEGLLPNTITKKEIDAN